MKFTTAVYDYEADLRNQRRREQWRDWFAWYPVNLSYPEHAKIIWLETIKVREVFYSSGHEWKLRTQASLEKDGPHTLK